MGPFLVACIALVFAGSPPEQTRPTVRPTTKTTAEAQATVGDELFVTVHGFKDYTGKFTVVNDGTITIPPIGTVRVQGRTLASVRTEITARLTPYVRDPKVTVAFASKIDNYIYLVGTKDSDARQPYRPGIDLRMLMTGFSTEGDVSDLEGNVYRNGTKIASFNMRDLLTGKPDVWTGPLRPGDIVSVLPSEKIRVWFLNDFQKVGLIVENKGVSLAKALADAGGAKLPDRLSNYAQAYQERSRIVVRRGGEEYRFHIDNDVEANRFILEAGDTVSVEMPKAATVSVGGYVQKPASVTLLSGDDVFAAIAGAGGTAEGGTLQDVLVWRGNEVRRLDLRNAIRGGAKSSFTLQDGDSIYVQKNQRTFRVLGDAQKPGLYDLPDNGVVRAADALAIAQGTSPEGSLRKMVLMRADADGVYRGREFNLDEYIKDGKVSANPEIQPGDVLFVNKPKGGPSLRDVVSALPSLLVFGTYLQR